jgi:hypothetical protein
MPMMLGKWQMAGLDTGYCGQGALSRQGATEGFGALLLRIEAQPHILLHRSGAITGACPSTPHLPTESVTDPYRFVPDRASLASPWDSNRRATADGVLPSRSAAAVSCCASDLGNRMDRKLLPKRVSTLVGIATHCVMHCVTTQGVRYAA